MKTFLYLSVTFILILHCSSCSYPFYVHKTYDPEINLEKKPYKIVFVNIFDYTSPDNVKEKDEISYRTGVIKLMEGLSSSFAKDSAFIFLIGDTLRKEILNGQLTAIIPKDTILAICKRHNTDLLLTNDSADFFFNWETQRQDDDLKEKSFYLYTNFYLSLYSATGELINRSTVGRNVFYESRPALSALITFKPSLSKATEAIESLAFEAGLDYIDKFYPVTAEEPRMLYSGKAFKESNLFIRLRNWDKAIELLDQLAKSPNQNIAMKARHNLSVLNEAKVSDN